MLRSCRGVASCYWHLAEEARDAAKHLTVSRTAPTIMHYPSPVSVVLVMRNLDHRIFGSFSQECLVFLSPQNEVEFTYNLKPYRFHQPTEIYSGPLLCGENVAQDSQ